MAGWFIQGWEVKARALHRLKTFKPQHVSAETCPKELTLAPSRTFIQAGMMFSEIKHPHFKLHPQGHGGFAETLAGLFRGGGGEGQPWAKRPAVCRWLVGRFGCVFTPLRNQLQSPEWAQTPERENVGGSAGQERRGGR